MARNARAVRVSVIFGSPWGSSNEQNLGGKLSARRLIEEVADGAVASMAGDDSWNQYHGEECESDESVSHLDLLGLVLINNNRIQGTLAKLHFWVQHCTFG